VNGCCKGCRRCLLVVVLMKLCSWRRRRTQRAKADTSCHVHRPPQDGMDAGGHGEDRNGHYVLQYCGTTNMIAKLTVTSLLQMFRWEGVQRLAAV
jgi:hypothetical protein